jgi:translation initiation factor 2D
MLFFLPFVIHTHAHLGVEKIISINYDHPEIVSHKAQKVKNDDNTDTSSASHLLLTKMTELYVVNETTKKLFNSLGVECGKALERTQIKNYVKDYVSRNKLIDPLTKLVTVDDVLLEVCAVKRESSDPILMNLEQLHAIVESQMDNTFEMRSQSGPDMKGAKRRPVIQISTATRMGNKKVTLVSNLEAYGINIADFSKACKVGVQASVAITKVAGTNINQFQIQGNHVRFIYNLLNDTYKIAKGDITGLEYAKKEKSKKK